jgi:glycolate oxidase FAD binding subunit
VALGAWEALDCALGGPVVLKLACEIRRTAAWLGRVEALAARAALDAAVVGQAGNGVLHVALGDAGPAARELVDALRGELAGEGGSAVVERAPEPFKATCDVWGPIAPAAFAIMERLKREFDPAGLLNPGRFVGGL